MLKASSVGYPEIAFRPKNLARVGIMRVGRSEGSALA